MKLYFHLQGVLPRLWLPSLSKHLLLFTDQGWPFFQSIFYTFIAWPLVLFRFKWPELYLQTRAKDQADGIALRGKGWINIQYNGIVVGFLKIQLPYQAGCSISLAVRILATLTVGFSGV